MKGPEFIVPTREINIKSHTGTGRNILYERKNLFSQFFSNFVTIKNYLKYFSSYCKPCKNAIKSSFYYVNNENITYLHLVPIFVGYSSLYSVNL